MTVGGGMSGEWHLGPGRKDTNASDVRRVVRRQDERCLCEIELVGYGLHLGFGQATRVRDNSDGIAAELAVGEDVDGLEFNLH